jgi:hypothetical protein
MTAIVPAPWFPWAGDGIKTDSGVRRPILLMKVVDQFRVETTSRYQPKDGQTFCNIYLWDVTRALGAEIPHWIEVGDMEGGTPVRHELNINHTIQRLEAGLVEGWSECTAEHARAASNLGCPTVATWLNSSGPHGHVAVCLPSTTGEEQQVSQAGSVCFSQGGISRAFGPDKLPAVRWWTHA